MNRGTQIRTALAIVVSIHTALMATDLTGFHNPTVNLVYKIVSLAVNFIMVALVTYYNNDYTEEGEIGTELTRQLKACASEDELQTTFNTDDFDEYLEAEEVENEDTQDTTEE